MAKERTEEFLKAINFEWDDLDFDDTDQAKKIKRPEIQKPYDPDKPLVPLTPYGRIEKPSILAFDALANRKSRRRYSPECLSLPDLSALLYFTQGIRVNQANPSFRSVPSAGARHAFETYLFIDRVSGVKPGLYRYLPVEHSLTQCKEMAEADKASLNDALCGQLFDSAVFFIWSALPYRMSWRYSFAAAKLLAIDIGHVCENLYIACETVGCGTCGIGAYNQGALDDFLDIDGQGEFAIYAASVGKLGE
jgi:SagB-type dehydrogenase family enzyme